MRTSRGCTLAIALIFLALIGRQAAAQSIEIGADEVYLDTDSKALSGRMRQGYEDTDINRVAIIAPENAHVTLFYWVGRGTPVSRCEGTGVSQVEDAAQKNTAQKRAAAPTGAVVEKNGVRVQKFVGKIGPLTTGLPYCFAYVVQSTKVLSAADKAAVAARLGATLERLTMAMALPPDAAQAALRKRLAGSSVAEDQLAACTEVLRQRKALIAPKDFATLFNCELGWPLNQLVVLDASGNWTTLRSAMERYLSQDPKFAEGLSAALQRGYALQTRRNELNAALDRKLVGVGDSLPDRSLVYDPLAGIDAARFGESITDNSLKAEFGGNIRDRAEFVDKVWAHRAELSGTAKRRALDVPAEARLKAFFFESDPGHAAPKPRTLQPKYLKVAPEQLRDASDAIRKILDDPDFVAQATPAPSAGQTAAAAYAAAVVSLAGSLAKLLPTLPALDELETYPGIEDPKAAPDGPRILGVAFEAERRRTDFEALVKLIQETKTAKDAVLASETYKRLEDWLRTAVDSSGTGSFVTQPTYKERLPFWVTGDVGVVLGFFGREGQPTETGASLYFGLNFYLQELDKSEPLHIYQWQARDFLRRFALNAGITLTQPSGVKDIEGVIGSKLLMTGAGLRLTDYLRVNGGVLYYVQKDTSPLSDDKTIKLAPYFSTSLDVDVIGTVNGWFTSTKTVVP